MDAMNDAEARYQRLMKFGSDNLGLINVTLSFRIRLNSLIFNRMLVVAWIPCCYSI